MWVLAGAEQRQQDQGGPADIVRRLGRAGAIALTMFMEVVHAPVAVRSRLMPCQPLQTAADPYGPRRACRQLVRRLPGPPVPPTGQTLARPGRIGDDGRRLLSFHPPTGDQCRAGRSQGQGQKERRYILLEPGQRV